jgi:hypothetical protein
MQMAGAAGRRAMSGARRQLIVSLSRVDVNVTLAWGGLRKASP